MKKIIIYLSIILISNIYAQCDDYSQSQCSNDNNCEWVEDIESGNCNFAWSESNCQAHDGCEWECEMVWDSSLWEDVLVCDCYGQYQFDAGYCQEVQMPDCSEMGLLQCSSNDNCDWVSDIEYGSCSEFDQNTSACEATVGCYGAYQYPGWYSGWYCAGGNYQIDNSYCQEIEMPECSEMNETECSSNGSCDWIEDYEWSSCSNYDSATECSWANNNGGNCDWSWNSTEWQDTCSGGSFQLDTSYCEETEYQLGDLNQDSFINIQDVILVINLILNGEFDLSADMNLDSIVNVLDVIQIVNIILSN